MYDYKKIPSCAELPPCVMYCLLRTLAVVDTSRMVMSRACLLHLDETVRTSLPGCLPSNRPQTEIDFHQYMSPIIQSPKPLDSESPEGRATASGLMSCFPQQRRTAETKPEDVPPP